jgi:3-isopropylmalate/(R)-2-methylmalate dehydratase small subunit
MKIKALKGAAIPIKGNNIDTDQILPARFLKELTFENMHDYFFYDVRFDENGALKKHPINDPSFADASIMISGKNLGCGSSREHAPQAIKRFGIEAIIAESYAEIFAGNCAALGLLLVTASKEDIDTLISHTENHPETVYKIDLDKKIVKFGHNYIEIDMPDERRLSFLNGTWNVLSLLKENMDLVRKTAESLPDYFS